MMNSTSFTMPLINLTAARIPGSPLRLAEAILHSDYDRFEIPRVAGSDEPAIIFISIVVIGLGGFRIEEMDYRANMYLQQSWLDPHLAAFSQYLPIETHSTELMNVIWRPDIYFSNSKNAQYELTPEPNQQLVVYPNGTLYLSRRLGATFTCMMNLRSYPMDRQNCPMKLEIYSQNINRVKLKWRSHKPFRLTPNPLYRMNQNQSGRMNHSHHHHRPVLNLAEFQVHDEDLRHEDCGDQVEYSCIVAWISIRRSCGFHMFQTFIPTCTIVVISWLNFWIEAESIPARVTLSLTTLLTLTTQASGLRAVLPPVAYVKAIDIWMMTCTLFLVMCFLEFVVANTLASWERRLKAEEGIRNVSRLAIATGLISFPGANVPRPQTRENRKKSTADDKNTPMWIAALTKEKAKEQQAGTKTSVSAKPSLVKPVKLGMTADQVDRVCQFAFPAAFFLFNLVFWNVYPPHFQHDLELY